MERNPTERDGMAAIMRNAWEHKTAIPAFNIPYLPMMAPVVRALQDTSCFGLVAVARLEWIKFKAGSLRDIYDTYQTAKDERFTRLHVDHVPVIDEDHLQVDYMADLSEAVEMGYDSIMVDGSRLPLDENIAATRRVVGMAHVHDVPVEAELGAILGHEAGPLPPYEELFASGKGFTDPEEARRFVAETGVDWLSVAIGSIHGAITAAKRAQKKIEARLSLERLDAIREATGIPIVLHGGTGIRKEHILEAIKHGVAKINVATAIRQPYEALVDESVEKALEAVYKATVACIREDLELEGSAEVVNPAGA
jgi:ketose-bisphosphate aldolase